MLDDNQLEAVRHFTGPCLTLAGPGSGKTTVLVNRIKHLIDEYHVNPQSILVITFTKDAALEMKSRFISLCNNPKAGLVNFGTFHSVFYSILRSEMKLETDSILQGKNLISFLKEVVLSLSIEFDDGLLEGLYKEISYVNNTTISINEYESEGFDVEEFRKLYNAFQSMKKELGKIDFDDMLMLTYNLFRENPKVLSKWQQRYSFYLIDEMQDMNDLQFGIVKMLAISRNVFAVGDDDQSIYGFRGANPNIMLDFPKEYDDCKVIKLCTNYRSCASIVEQSSKLISSNEKRFNKVIVANNTNSGNISTHNFKDADTESKWICAKLKTLLNRDESSTVAILFRNKNQNISITNMLSEKGVPFFVKDKVSNIYSHFIFKDIISYMNIALGEGKRSDFLRIYNKPNRYIRRECIDRENVSFDDMVRFYSDKPYMQNRIRNMKSDITRLRGLRPSSAILFIRKKIGYDNYIAETANNKKQYDDYMRVLENVTSLSKGFINIKAFLEECNMRLEYEEGKTDESHARVFLYTFHASKGLEFDNVFILDVNEGVTPSKKAESQEALEEERRMFYVALTHAKTNLTLCYIQRRNNEKLFPSRFIEEMQIN